MRSVVIAIVLAVGVRVAHAEEYLFSVHRFCEIVLDADSKVPCVEITVYPKAVEKPEVLFRSELRLVDDKVYESPNKILFKVEHLKRSVVNDGNRGINSGDWRLEITGENPDFQRLKDQLTSISAFRSPDSDSAQKAMHDLVCYGMRRDGE